MATTRPPFRADHVGSLLRPRHLIEARAAVQAGTLDAAAFREIEDGAVRDCIRLQEDIGLLGVTDGELRRGSWHMDYIYQIGGIEEQSADMHIQFQNEAGDLDVKLHALKVVDRLSLPSTIFERDFRFVQDHARAGVPKLTIPSPSMVHYRGGRKAVDETVYPDIEDFYADLSHVYAQEIANLDALGCTYLQLDDTSLAYLNDPAQRALIASQGGDADRQHEVYIRIINAAVKHKPAGMTMTTHLCRGNFRSSWAASGSYDYVADALFNELDVDGYFLEFDDERSGGFEPLRLLPKGNKRVVLGLVTSKRGELEDKDEIKRRIDEAAKFAPMEQLCLSAQCGFSSTHEGNDITEDQQRAKLEMIVEIAQDMWGEL
jgi:5-methyltetrahydropteroyltriglutamate--homocysteine methyltransferase